MRGGATPSGGVVVGGRPRPRPGGRFPQMTVTPVPPRGVCQRTVGSSRGRGGHPAHGVGGRGGGSRGFPHCRRWWAPLPAGRAPISYMHSIQHTSSTRRNIPVEGCVEDLMIGSSLPSPPYTTRHPRSHGIKRRVGAFPPHKCYCSLRWTGRATGALRDPPMVGPRVEESNHSRHVSDGWGWGGRHLTLSQKQKEAKAGGGGVRRPRCQTGDPPPQRVDGGHRPVGQSLAAANGQPLGVGRDHEMRQRRPIFVVPRICRWQS